AQDFLGRSDRAPILMFFDPHGVSPRFPSLMAIKERPLGDVNHKPSGQDLWAHAHRRLGNSRAFLSAVAEATQMAWIFHTVFCGIAAHNSRTCVSQSHLLYVIG